LILASGLNSPRKLSFGPDGDVAEAGRGEQEPVFRRNRARLVFYGATGAITRIQNGVAERVVTDLHRWHYPMDRWQVSTTLFDGKCLCDRRSWQQSRQSLATRS